MFILILYNLFTIILKVRDNNLRKIKRIETLFEILAKHIQGFLFTLVLLEV